MADVTQTTQVAARVPVDLVARLNKIAEANERSASAEVRLAIRAHVERAEAEEVAA